MLDKKTQKSGDKSLNIQAKDVDVHIGLTYDNARQIALDVFNANFLQLSEKAANIAFLRAQELIDFYLRRVSEKGPHLLRSAEDPDMQYALFTAQKEYARSGDKDLSELLVDILIDRAAETNRSVLQIVLNEALSVAPKLTVQQFNVLSLIYIIKYTRQLDLNGLDDFAQYIRKLILPFTDNFRSDNACFQHLEYAGCGNLQADDRIVYPAFARLSKAIYPGLFWRGATENEIEELLMIDQRIKTIVIPCLHNADLYQFDVIDGEELREECQVRGLDDATIRTLLSFQVGHLFDDGQVHKIIKELVPEFTEFMHTWGQSLRRFSLTSVGIAIAHANIRRKTGREFNLNIWIN